MAQSARNRGMLVLLALFQIQLLGFAAADSQVYVVYLGSPLRGVAAEVLASTHLATLRAALDSSQSPVESLIYSYTNAFNGFSCLLTEEGAEAMGELPNVRAIFPSKLRQYATTHSWSFLGLNAKSTTGVWAQSRYGKKVIIGLLDTGVWPESPSFRDQGMSSVPSKWKGICQAGDSFNTSTCNKKLIGGRYFLKAFEAGTGRISGFRSARDDQGHGSHVASIAAGQSVRKANLNGVGKGVARGGAPHAHLAVYKVCWSSPLGLGCNDADLLAGLDAAVADGVDVISISIVQENPQPPYEKDAVAIGTFHAIQRGIFVAAAAGNSGQQGSATASNLAPWLITVAASSTDRLIGVDVSLGNGAVLKGTLLSSVAVVEKWPVGAFNIINGADAFSAGAQGFSSANCEFLDITKIKDKYLLCGFDPNLGFPSSTSLDGAKGVIFITSQDLIDVPSQTIIYPAVAVDQATANAIRAYIGAAKPATAVFSRPVTRLGAAPAPLMAGFSSRGPSTLSPDILKPDITAPGVQILAAWSPFVNFLSDYNVDESADFNFQSGTSMSCPHVAGVAALIKAIHPGWSPAAIKSALMTTASSDGIRDAVTNALATPLAFGAGHINPRKAADPGLVYDASPADYTTFLCSTGMAVAGIKAITGTAVACPQMRPQTSDLNVPSVAIAALVGSRTVSRTVTNVGPAAAAVYTATVVPPAGVSVQVVPPVLRFTALGQSLGFKLIFTVRADSAGKYVFGKITWSDGPHSVQSPIAVIAVR